MNISSRVLTTLLLCGAVGLAGCDLFSDGGGTDGDDEPDFVAIANSGQTVPRSPDRGNSAHAEFRFVDDGARLAYEIQFDGLDLGGIKGTPATADTSDDVTKIHLHSGEIGVKGDHVFNIFGAPSEDDDDMTFDAEAGTLSGVWDDGDENLSLPEGARTFKLSDVIGELCSGNLYLNIHSKFFAVGEVRGQVLPVAAPDACGF